METIYRVAICDDNAKEGRHVCEIAKSSFRKRNIEADISLFFSPEELLSDVGANQSQYDLFILDILMDKIDGIELALILRDKGSKAKLIYTTSSRDYALDGYKVQANDYLLKPIESDALDASIGRILTLRNTILVEADGAMKTISVSDILFAEAVGHYIVLRMTSGGEIVRLRATLSKAQQTLGEKQFARCHKGYLVNLAQVLEIGISRIRLRGGTEIPLGRQYRYAVREKMVQYVEKAVPL